MQEPDARSFDPCTDLATELEAARTVGGRVSQEAGWRPPAGTQAGKVYRAAASLQVIGPGVLDQLFNASAGRNMEDIYNGMPASQLSGAAWRKSARSNPNGACVEMAVLGGEKVAVRNSRFPTGPTILCTRSEMLAFIAGLKEGEFDHVLS